MNCKKVIINNFRNIYVPTEEDIKSNKQNGNVLILSHNTDEGSIVTLIGPNNAGKSNVLDSLIAKKKDLFQNKPDWEYLWTENDHKVSIIIQDQSIYLENKKNISKILQKNKMSDSELKKINNAFFVLNFSDACDLLNSKNYNEDKFLERLSIESNSNFQVVLLLFYLSVRSEGSNTNTDSVDWLNAIYNNLALKFDGCSYYSSLLSSVGTSKISQKLIDIYSADDKTWKSNNSFEKLNFNKEANVLRFNQNEIIKNVALEFDVSSPSSFLNQIKKIIDPDDTLFKSIQKLMNSGQPSSVISGQIDSIIQKLNSLIKSKITDRFNDLYFLENEKYDFRIQRLDSYKKYSFGIFLVKPNGENVVLNLDKQSDGFKWFFNFYFQILKDKELSKGTIVLLEEPAVNLHIEGQKKWLSFIREFAFNNKIVFVMTTHSPFLIDCDHLDDIRIIYKDGEFTKINNYFSVDVENSGESSLEVLIDSFTWHNIIATLLNKNDRLVLVEGITDYMYLNYFKQKSKEFNNLHFIPINGLGKKRTFPKVIQNVIDQFGSSSVILIDNDVAGKDFEDLIKKNKTDLRVININSANEKYKQIEDLFCIKDIEKYDFIKEKNASKIIGLCRSSGKVFEKETEDAFLKLLKTIKENL